MRLREMRRGQRERGETWRSDYMETLTGGSEDGGRKRAARAVPRQPPILLSTSVQKVAPWAFTARLFLVVKWGLAIEIAGEKLSWTRETMRVWAADHDDWSAKVAGEGCKRPLEA